MAMGDHIRVRRRGYWHHGIDCGDGTVIHYCGVNSEKVDPVVRRTSYEEFTKGACPQVVEAGAGHCPESIVARAMARLGENNYRLLRNNCEHFAAWCQTGISTSRQVGRGLGAAALTLSAVTAGMTLGGALLTRRLLRRDT